MRKVLMGFLCTLSMAGHATDYYVSSTGNDSANGLSSSTPWKTISKVNAEFSRINPGDRILFRRGDVFYGTITVAKSGTAGSPIIISSYGTGALPRISGFTAITGCTHQVHLFFCPCLPVVFDHAVIRGTTSEGQRILTCC